MSYIPIIWLLFSIVLAPRRPGFLLGCAILSFQFDSLYNNESLSPAIFVLLVCFVAFSVLKQKQFIVLNRYDALLSIFAMMYIGAAVYSVDSEIALKVANRMLAFGLGYYVVGRFLSASTVYKERYFLDFGISILVLSSIISILALTEFTGVKRLLLGTGSAVGFSQMIDVAIGFSLFYFLMVSWTEKFAYRMIMLGSFLLMAVMLAYSGTRGAAASLVFGVCIFIAARMISEKDSYGAIRTFLPIGLIFVGALTVMLQLGDRSELASLGLSRLGNMFYGSAGFLGDESSSMRKIYYRQAWEMFADSPFLGYGLGGFKAVTSAGYPHNVFLELMSETGIFTTIVFTAFTGATAWVAVRLIRVHSLDGSIAAGIFFITFAHLQVSFALWMAKPLFLMMGILVTLNQRRINEQLVPATDSGSRSVRAVDSNRNNRDPANDHHIAS